MPWPNPVASRPQPRPEPVSSTTTSCTLTDALAATYANNPALQSERAKLRATDESVPQALAGWRPQVSLAGTAGYGDGYSRQWLGGGTTTLSNGQVIGNPGRQNDARTQRDIATARQPSPSRSTAAARPRPP